MIMKFLSLKDYISYIVYVCVCVIGYKKTSIFKHFTQAKFENFNVKLLMLKF